MGIALEIGGTPVNGTSGSFAGTFAQPGVQCTDTTNGVLWVNNGTLASPQWGRVGSSLNFVNAPSTAQVMVAATTLLANARVVQVSTGSNITSTAAPTIADGVDGQMLTIINVGSFNYVISDQGTLASSNLRLTATTVTLAPRQSVELMYNATVGDWVQVRTLCAVV
jgi:hypothetical protein